MFFSSINYLLVIIAALNGFVISLVWHSHYFFENKHSVPKTTNKKITAIKYLSIAIITFIQALVIAVLLNSLIIIGIWGFIVFICLIWAGFVLPVKVTDYLVEKEKFYPALLSACKDFVIIAVMSFIILFFS